MPKTITLTDEEADMLLSQNLFESIGILTIIRDRFSASIEKAKGEEKHCFHLSPSGFPQYGAKDSKDEPNYKPFIEALNSLLTWARSQGYKG